VGVIERGFAQTADIRFPTEMVGMTASTLACGCQRISTVKALTIRYVVCDELMASEA